jgi:hypothetical protein
MGLGFFVLAICAVVSAFGLIMNHNGRKADRERRGY